MSTTTHSSSIHIDAPVETVFDYLTDPTRVYEASYQKRKPVITDKRMTPGAGAGSRYRFAGRLGVFPVHGEVTREDYVRDERIVDGYRDGRNTYTVQPDPPGTTLTLTVESSSPLTVLNKGKDLLMRPDRNLDTWLANIKAAIET
jgi:uncharacterized protein YndB with AHSA1/START domain